MWVVIAVVALTSGDIGVKLVPLAAPTKAKCERVRAIVNQDMHTEIVPGGTLLNTFCYQLPETA